jgi:hypothetical protein
VTADRVITLVESVWNSRFASRVQTLLDIVPVAFRKVMDTKRSGDNKVELIKEHDEFLVIVSKTLGVGDWEVVKDYRFAIEDKARKCFIRLTKEFKHE